MTGPGRVVTAGVLSVGFGVLALANMLAASVAVTLMTGILFVLVGGIQIAAGWDEPEPGPKLLQLALGALVLLLGVTFLAHPLRGAVTLAFAVTVLLAASGVIRLAFAYVMRSTRLFWGMLVSGALSVLLAAVIFANFGAVSPGLMGLLLGIELIVNGAGLIALGQYLRGRMPR